MTITITPRAPPQTWFMLGVLGGLGGAAVKRNSVSHFSNLSHVQVILTVISLVCHLKYPYSWFFSLFLFTVFLAAIIRFVLGYYILILQLLATVISISLFFFIYFMTLNYYIYICWRVRFFIFFYTVCPCHPTSVRACILSLISVFFDPLVRVPLLSSLRRILNILQGELSRYLFLWCRFWFWEYFLFF